MSDETEDRDSRLSFGARMSGLVWASLAFLTILSYWQGPYLLNLVSPFRFQLWLVLCLVSLPALLFFPKKRKGLFVAFPLLVGLTFVSYLPLKSDYRGPEIAQLTVAVANIYSGNSQTQLLGDWLVEVQPDLLGVLEVSSLHTNFLESLDYTHRTLHPQTNNFGLALLSKEKPLRVELLEVESRMPAIWAEFDKYQVLLAHPIPPISKEAREMGDRQMERMALKLKEVVKPTIVLGDLNAAGWDKRMEPLQEMGLVEARKGFGMLPTWPCDRAILRIPIDHILATPDLEILECQRGPEIGSDHFPLLARLKKP